MLMSQEQPSCWVRVKLGHICTKPQYGYTTKSISSGDVKYLRTTDITKSFLDWSSVPFCENPPEDLEKYQVKNRDIVISRAGSIGYSCLLCDPPINAVFASYLIRFEPSTLISEFYLKYFLESQEYWDQLKSMSVGNAVQNVNAKKLSEIVLPIPSFTEQKVIADKLDVLLAQVETTKARLESTLETLKQFRQSVLAAAVSGKLTEDWRERHTNASVDSLQIVQQHKAYFVNQKKKYKEPLEFKSNELTPIIPNSWLWYRAEQLCDLITKGTTPKKENMSSSGDVPYIKVYNLTFDGSLDFSIDPTFVPSSVHKNELKRSKVFPGDVLMNIVGPPLGKVSIVPDSYDEWNINQAISIFRPICGVSNQYLSLCLRDEYLLDLTKSKAKATAGQFNLTLEICRDYSIPVPPLEEQNEIVRRVNKLLSGADLTEQQINQALERVNNLTQSILAKAFRGELTEQWRKDNPDLISGDNSAEALLKKIKAERKTQK